MDSTGNFFFSTPSSRFVDTFSPTQHYQTQQSHQPHDREGRSAASSAIGANDRNSICFSVGTKKLYLPLSLGSTEALESSRLAMLMTLDVPDGVEAAVTSDGEIVLDRNPEAFQLLTKHLNNEYPLAALASSCILEKYKLLVEEMRFWGLEPSTITLPYKLWTKSRWSDLTGFYCQSKEEEQTLEMKPVAVQLPDGTVQGLQMLQHMDPFSPEIANRLPNDVGSHEVVAAFSWWAYSILMCDLRQNTTISCPTNDEPLRKFHEDPLRKIMMGNRSATADLSRLASSPQNAQPEQIETPCVTTFFISIPHCDRIISYDLSRFMTEIPQKGGGYPHVYRRLDKHVLWIDSSFGLELQEIRDTVTGGFRIRCEAVLAKSVPAALPLSARSGSAGGKKDELTWQCFHPTLGCRYSNNIRWLKELGEYSRVKLFPWGALLVQSRLENPFAVISVDLPELHKVHKEKKIAVYVRGLERAASEKLLKRDSVDIVTTASLDRIYMIAGTQVASIPLMQCPPKVEFEIYPTKEGIIKFRFAHIDVSEGCPQGHSMQFLDGAGMLSEFDVMKGLYLQNELCKVVCSKYTKVQPTTPTVSKF